MGKFVDLTGQCFGHWKVLERANKKGKQAYWVCMCDCGVVKVVGASSLRNGTSKSCGCKDGKLNPYYIKDEVVYVKLSNCEDFMLCDIDDWYRLRLFKWHKDSLGYAACSKLKKRCHCCVIDSNSNNQVIDHINRNRLDNRKSNLRVVSYKENVRNSNKKSTNKSGIVGVWYDKQRMKWCAGISANGVSISLGRYDTIADAYTARVHGENKYWGCNDEAD